MVETPSSLVASIVAVTAVVHDPSMRVSSEATQRRLNCSLQARLFNGGVISAEISLCQSIGLLKYRVAFGSFEAGSWSNVSDASSTWLQYVSTRRVRAQ